MALPSKKLTTVSESENPQFFPQEIITDILTRLPVKSLCRFKCVSKPWLSLISSPRFVKTHLQTYSPNFPRILINLGRPTHHLKHCSLNSLINNSAETAINIYYPNKRTHRFVFVVGSCNGLVCLSFIPDLFLFNPCTRLYKKLPPVNIEMNNWESKKHEFAYDAVDDDYKVLCLFAKTGELQVNIYSWRANSWKTRVFVNSGITGYCEKKFFAGKVHVGTCDPGLDVDDDSPILFDIVSFDLESGGVCGTIEQPDYGDGVAALFMVELEGCFGVVCRKETYSDLWVMKEYGVKASWTKMLTVSFLDDRQKAVRVNPLTILPSGEILMAFEASLEVYNLQDNSSRVLNTRKFGRFLAAYLYVESLVSPTQHERMGRQEDH